jgi:Zn-finger nucleic acid-binding protein
MFSKNMFKSKSGLFNFFKQKPRRFDLSKEDSILKCPRCQVDMRKITRSGITIDVCDYCHGMWLDNGELEQLRLLNDTNRFSEDSPVNDASGNLTADEKELSNVIPAPFENVKRISSDIRKAETIKSRAGSRKKMNQSKTKVGGIKSSKKSPKKKK